MEKYKLSIHFEAENIYLKKIIFSKKAVLGPFNNLDELTKSVKELFNLISNFFDDVQDWRIDNFYRKLSEEDWIEVNQRFDCHSKNSKNPSEWVTIDVTASLIPPFSTLSQINQCLQVLTK